MNPILDPKTQTELLLWLGYWDIKWFAKFFFAEHCKYPFSQMHTELFELMQDGIHRRGQKRIIAAPRGHAKTTLALIIQVIHSICYQYEPLIVIVAQSRREAQERVINLLNELRTNELIKHFFGQLAPPSGLGSRDGFMTQNNIRIKALSIEQSIRGTQNKNNRPSLIILDDVETWEATLSTEQREKLIERFNKDILPAGQIDGTTNITVIGTRLHHESLISYLLNRPDWQARQYQAILKFSTKQELWDEWRQIYMQIENPSREKDADEFFKQNQTEMLEGTQVLWAEVEPYYRLMKMEVEMGKRAFYSEKQNEPFDPSDQLFDMENATYFDWDNGLKEIRTELRDTIPINNIQTIYAYLDPALGASGTKGDDTAIVVAGKDQYGYMYVLDAVIELLKPTEYINAIVKLYKQWQFDCLYVEDVAFQKLLIPPLRENLKEQGYDFRVLGNSPSIKKEERIASLEPYITNGQLLFRKGINRKLIDQLAYFPAARDDGPDALEGAVSKLIFRKNPQLPIERPNPDRRGGLGKNRLEAMQQASEQNIQPELDTKRPQCVRRNLSKR